MLGPMFILQSLSFYSKRAFNHIKRGKGARDIVR